MAEKPKELAGYVKAADVANLLDITIQRVGQLKKEGIFKQYKTPAGDRYLLVETIKAYIKYLREQQSSKSKWEEQLKQYKAEMARLQYEELVGTMHRSEDVEALTTDLVFATRAMIMALPGRLAVDMATIKTAAEASIRIEQECRTILDELASYKYDPDKYKKRVRDREGWKATADGQDEE